MQFYDPSALAQACHEIDQHMCQEKEYLKISPSSSSIATELTGASSACFASDPSFDKESAAKVSFNYLNRD